MIRLTDHAKAGDSLVHDPSETTCLGTPRMFFNIGFVIIGVVNIGFVYIGRVIIGFVNIGLGRQACIEAEETCIYYVQQHLSPGPPRHLLAEACLNRLQQDLACTWTLFTTTRAGFPNARLSGLGSRFCSSYAEASIALSRPCTRLPLTIALGEGPGFLASLQSFSSTPIATSIGGL